MSLLAFKLYLNCFVCTFWRTNVLVIITTGCKISSESALSLIPIALQHTTMQLLAIHTYICISNRQKMACQGSELCKLLIVLCAAIFPTTCKTFLPMSCIEDTATEASRLLVRDCGMTRVKTLAASSVLPGV